MARLKALCYVMGILGLLGGAGLPVMTALAWQIPMGACTFDTNGPVLTCPDTVALGATMGLGLPQQDSAALGDSIAQGVGLGRSDHSDLSEALQQALGIPRSDAAALSHALLLGLPQSDQAGLIASLQQGLGISRDAAAALSAALLLGISGQDAASLAEAILVGLPQYDTATLADATAKGLSIHREDVAALADALQNALSLSRADAAALAAALFLGLSGQDAASLAEAMLLGLPQHDTATLAGALQKSPGLARQDVASLTDALQHVPGLSRADAAALTAALLLRLPQQDAASLAEVLLPGLPQHDMASLAGAVSKAASLYREDLAALTEALQNAFILSRTEATSLAAVLLLGLSGQDAASLTEAVLVGLPQDDTATLAVALRKAFDLPRGDAATLGEAARRAAALPRGEAASLHDSFATGLPKADAVGMTEDTAMNFLGTALPKGWATLSIPIRAQPGKDKVFNTGAMGILEDTLSGPTTLLDDGQAAGWVSYNLPDQLTLSDSTAAVKSGANSLQMNILVANRKAFSLAHYAVPASSRDWSSKQYLTFWYKGLGSGVPFSIRFVFGNGSSVAYYLTDAAGWTQKTVTLRLLSSASGLPDSVWGEVTDLRLAYDTKAVTGSIYLDGLILWDELLTPQDGIMDPSKVSIAYKANAASQSWVQVVAGDTVSPLEVLVVNSTAAHNPSVVLSQSLSVPPSRSLSAGWNLVGVALPPNTASLAANELLAGLYNVPTTEAPKFT